MSTEKLKYFGVMKGRKYLKGVGYAGGRGGSIYKFSWTFNESEARRWIETDSTPDIYADMTKGKIVSLSI